VCIFNFIYNVYGLQKDFGFNFVHKKVGQNLASKEASIRAARKDHTQLQTIVLAAKVVETALSHV